MNQNRLSVMHRRLYRLQKSHHQSCLHSQYWLYHLLQRLCPWSAPVLHGLSGYCWSVIPLLHLKQIYLSLYKSIPCNHRAWPGIQHHNHTHKHSYLQSLFRSLRQIPMQTALLILSHCLQQCLYYWHFLCRMHTIKELRRGMQLPVLNFSSL